MAPVLNKSLYTHKEEGTRCTADHSVGHGTGDAICHGNAPGSLPVFPFHMDPCGGKDTRAG